MEIEHWSTIHGSQVAGQMYRFWHVIRMSISTAKLFRDLPPTHHLGLIKWNCTLVVSSGIEVLILQVKSH